MSVFETFFDDVGFPALVDTYGHTGTYQSIAGGDTVACQVVITKDVVIEPTSYDSNTVTTGTVIETMVSVVGDVAIGDTVVVEGTTYTFKKELENNGRVTKWVVHD